MGHKSSKTGRQLEPARKQNAAPWLRKTLALVGLTTYGKASSDDAPDDE